MKLLHGWVTQPRTLALLGLGVLGVCAVMLHSKTGTIILVNLIPAILFMGVPALIVWGVIVYATNRVGGKPVKDTVEDRLDELERLKRRDMVTAEEYALKRQDILNDL